MGMPSSSASKTKRLAIGAAILDAAHIAVSRSILEDRNLNQSVDFHDRQSVATIFRKDTAKPRMTAKKRSSWQMLRKNSVS